MRVQYLSEEVRLRVIAIQHSDPHLHDRFICYLRTLRELDYEEMKNLID